MHPAIVRESSAACKNTARNTTRLDASTKPPSKTGASALAMMRNRTAAQEEDRTAAARKLCEATDLWMTRDIGASSKSKSGAIPATLPSATSASKSSPDRNDRRAPTAAPDRRCVVRFVGAPLSALAADGTYGPWSIDIHPGWAKLVSTASVIYGHYDSSDR